MTTPAGASVAPVITPVLGMSRTVHGATDVPILWGPDVPTLCGKSVSPWGLIWQPEAWPGMATSGHPDVCQECAAVTTGKRSGKGA